jgi:hypothetical protein
LDELDTYLWKSNKSEVRVSDKPKSVLDIIAWCQNLEARLNKLEKRGFQIADVGEFIVDESREINSGSGDRSYKHEVLFENELSAPPKILTSLSGLNVESSVNTAIKLETLNVTSKGAEIHIKTWKEATLPFVKVSWVALVALEKN